MWKYSILLSYLGTDSCGWQKQKVDSGKPSIQSTIEKALLRMTGEELSVVGSGRTDAGVHALGQVAHFVLKKKPWDTQIIRKGLNGLLPRSIQVLDVQTVPIDFHAQRSALKKQYSYYFQQGSCALPHLEPLSWWIQKRLDVESMSKALQHLVGEHDFKPFQASGANPGPTVRSILEADVTRISIGFPAHRSEGVLGLQVQEDLQSVLGGGLEGPDPFNLVRVRVLGTGFLKQMVRGIAGTLLQVGEGRRPASCMSEILESQNRLLVGPTAPARALWLEQVWYA